MNPEIPHALNRDYPESPSIRERLESAFDEMDDARAALVHRLTQLYKEDGAPYGRTLAGVTPAL